LKKGLTISLILILLVSIKVFAEELEVPRLDFNQAIDVALRNNNEIRALRNALSATERDIGIARSEIMPKVRLLENFMVTNNPIEAFGIKLNQTRAKSGDLAFGTLDYPGANTNFLTSGIIEQTLYNKKSMIAIKMAKIEYSANGYIYLRKQEELIKNVAHGYITILTSQELIEIAKAGLTDKKEHLKIANFRYKNKHGLYSDVLRAETEVSEAQQKLIMAELDLKVAKGGLGLLIGNGCDVEITSPTPTLGINSIEYYTGYSVYRNDIKAMEINVENSKNNIKMAQAGWLPTLNASASYNLYNKNYPFGADGSNYIAGAFLKWDAFDGNKRKYETLKAQDKSLEAKEHLEGLRKLVKCEVGKAYVTTEELIKTYEISQAALKSAQEGERLVLKRWQASDSPFVDVLDAQMNLDRARANVVKTRNDLKAQIITLYFDSGTIKNDLRIR